MYCDNRCSSRFNPKESRELIDELRQGRPVRKGGAVYVPIGAPEPVKIEEKPVKKTTEVKKDDGKQRGNSTDGRPNRELATSSGSPERQSPAERFASWLWGDDDIA